MDKCWEEIKAYVHHGLLLGNTVSRLYYHSSGKSWEYPGKEKAFLSSSETVSNFNLLHYPQGKSTSHNSKLSLVVPQKPFQNKTF